MPVAPPVSYPGVYIQEVESPVHTITPVATSTTAFVGLALRGEPDKATLIHSFAEFQRTFGGLWTDSMLGFAVSDFFLNGGSDAVIVRVQKDAVNATLALPAASGSPITLEARNPGAWGNSLKARVSYPITTSDTNDPKYLSFKQNVADPAGVDVTDLFDLTIFDASSGQSEQFANITVAKGMRTIDKVVENESQLVQVQGSVSGLARPPAHGKATVANKSIWDAANSAAYTQASGGSDGSLPLDDAAFTGDEANKKGIYALKDADIFNLLVIPPYKQNATGLDVDVPVLASAVEFCSERRAMLIVDPPSDWNSTDKAVSGFPIAGLSPDPNAVIYFPRIKKANPLRGNQIEVFAPSGTIAGVIARTDRQRGVWKAPAGLEATLMGVYDFDVKLTDPENGELNPLGINCLRSRPGAGPVIWGARTTVGADQLSSQWKYLPVRRLALFIEESLYRGTQWAVFEPNDEPLWSQLRLNLGVFMHDLFRQGAFQGGSPKDAYFVNCDSTTTTQSDIDRGIVNVIVGFAPLKPAEFVVLYIQQIAGQLAT
jgi:phage tail sheath protein FI